MTAELLRRLDQSRVFQPVLPLDALSALHVPFDELTGGSRCEGRLQLLGGSTGQVLLIGASGSGKSSAVAWSITPEAGAFGIRVPVHAHVGDGAVRPVDLAGLVVSALRHAVGAEGIDLGLSGPSRSRWRRSVSVDLGVLSANLEEQLPAGLGEGLQERTDAIQQALAIVRGHGLSPVLVLDDTDKWVARDGQRQPAVEAFFQGPVRWLIDLDVSLVVHVHDRYVPYLGEASTWFAEQITIPELAPPQAREVLLARIEAVSPEAGPAFTAQAMDLLLGTVFEERRSIRTAIVLAGMAVKEAVLASKELVDRPAVEAAILDRQ